MQLAISSKDTEEEHVMYSRSENITFTLYNDANEVVDELFETLRSRYQDIQKHQWFYFDSVQLMYYKSHKVSFKPGGS